MANLPQTLGKPFRGAGIFIAALGLLAAGCVSSVPWVARREPMPTGTPTQAVVAWEPRVIVTADAASGGAPLPGLAGRMYLFDSACCHPLAHDGSLHAELFDASPTKNGDQPILLESWDIDPSKMKLLLRKDIIGWGYTLFLPWGTYSPAITQVQLKVCFTPNGGTPLYAPSAPMKLLDSNCPPPVVRETTHTPGAPAPAASSIQLLPPK